MKKLIAITGGIGSGKSVVSKMLVAMGFSVYDCDIKAKILMDSSEEIKDAIAKKISQDVIVNSNIDRMQLSKIVFNDNSKLQILNNIVHGAVRMDLIQWKNRLNEKFVFVETAILYQSKLNEIVDEVWEVCAPEEIRIKRVMNRNKMSEEQVKARINSQKCDVESNIKTAYILNDNKVAVLPQLINLLNCI